MLAGAATLVRCVTLGGDFGPLRPSDLDGTMAPPAASAHTLMSFDFGADGRVDHVLMWRFSFSKLAINAPQQILVHPAVSRQPAPSTGAPASPTSRSSTAGQPGCRTPLMAAVGLGAYTGA